MRPNEVTIGVLLQRLNRAHLNAYEGGVFDPLYFAVRALPILKELEEQLHVNRWEET